MLFGFIPQHIGTYIGIYKHIILCVICRSIPKPFCSEDVSIQTFQFSEHVNSVNRYTVPICSWKSGMCFAAQLGKSQIL